MDEIQKIQKRAGIVESSQSRYTQMLQDISHVVPQEYIEEVISRGRKVLKRQDRMVWFTRMFKMFCYTRMDITGPDTSEFNTHSPLAQRIQITGDITKLSKQRHDYMTKLAKKAGATIIELSSDVHSMFAGGMEQFIFEQEFEHCFSLGLPEIENVEFGFRPSQNIIEDMHRIEQEWRNQTSELATPAIQRGGELLIDLGGGWAWYDLKTPGCPEEGKTMGHCGNGAGREGDTVLSLRKTVQRGGQEYEKPHLTFILNQKSGALGEMKGRGNDKPSEKYHPAIIQLLLHDRIKTIKGGGYLPENNFSLDDLEEEVKLTLIRQKPSLADLVTMYEVFGFTDEVKQRMDATILEHSRYNYGKIEIDPNNSERFLLNVYTLDGIQELTRDPRIDRLNGFQRMHPIKPVYMNRMRDYEISLDQTLEKGIESEFEERGHDLDWKTLNSYTLGYLLSLKSVHQRYIKRCVETMNFENREIQAELSPSGETLLVRLTVGIDEFLRSLGALVTEGTYTNNSHLAGSIIRDGNYTVLKYDASSSTGYIYDDTDDVHLNILHQFLRNEEVIEARTLTRSDVNPKDVVDFYERIEKFKSKERRKEIADIRRRAGMY